MALPWLALAMASGLIGILYDRAVLGWQISGLLTSAGACAILIACARAILDQSRLPYFSLPGKALAIYLIGWLPLAGAAYLTGLIGPWIAVAFACCLLGRLSMLALLPALGMGQIGSWRLLPILRSSLGSIGAFLLLPAIFLILLVPVLGAIAASGADIAFLEAEFPSRGGPLTPLGLASELFARLLPILAAATVGLYQGALLREWQTSS